MSAESLEAALTAILIGAIGIFSPTRLALSVLMLTSATAAWGRALAYALATTAVFAVASIIGLLGVEAAGFRGAAPGVSIVLGLVMIGVAASMVVVHRRRQNLPIRESRHPVLGAAGVGAAVAIQSFGRLLVLLAGGYRIGTLTESFLPGLAFVGLMLAIWQAPVWSPMLVYVFRRERFDAMAARAQPAIDRIEEGVVGAIIVGVVGGWILIQGLRA